MKIRSLLSIIFVAGLLMAFPAISGATPTLELRIGNLTPITIDGVGNDVSYNQNFGPWSVSVIGHSTSYGGLDLQGTVYLMGDYTGRLVIGLSDTGFDADIIGDSLMANIYGTAPYMFGTGNENYSDDVNHRFGTTNTLSTFSSPDFVYGNSVEVVPVGDTYSLSQFVIMSQGASGYDHSEPWQFEAHLGGAPVPEPSSLILLGSGLIGAALFFPRRKK